MSSANRVASRRVEIIPSKLYWISDTVVPSGYTDSFYFCVDKDLIYEPFNKDFGPLNLGNIFKFVTEVERILNSSRSTSSESKTIYYHYTSEHSKTKTNSCFLMGAFQILSLHRSAEEAWEPFQSVPGIEGFVDAGFRTNEYRCTVLDCLRGLEYATRLGWFSINSFNIKEYGHYEKVDHGDLNWIVPNKLLAFSTPNDSETRGMRSFSIERYAPILKKFGVKAVVRLNDRLYDESKLAKHGIKHRDIFFEDGSCPQQEHIDSFLSVAENTEGAVAVHCKAGLGRTGTLIGLYMMKHYMIPAPALIGWMRLCRPGMVLGPQQQFLCKLQDEMFDAGELIRAWRNIPKELLSKMVRVGQETRLKISCSGMTSADFYRRELNQGEKLMNLKDEIQHHSISPMGRHSRKSTTIVYPSKEQPLRSSSALRAKSSNQKTHPTKYERASNLHLSSRGGIYARSP
jgi:cell division cycle 14